MSTEIILKDKNHKQNKRWQSIAGILAILAEIANIGIFVEAIAKWVPRVAAFAASPALIYLMSISDPLIYCFRAGIRLTRLAGRHLFGIKFEEEEHDNSGFKKIRTLGDILSLTLFIFAIMTFAGFILGGAVGITLAWVFSLSGLVPIAYCDYVKPAEMLKKRFDNYNSNKEITQEKKDRLEENYINKNNSKRLYIVLLVGLALLLICGTATAFAPPFLTPILYYTAKAASLLLGVIACSRFINFLFVPGCYLHLNSKSDGPLKHEKYAKNYVFDEHSSQLVYVTKKRSA